MIAVRYWSRSERSNGATPLGDISSVLTDSSVSERVFRSIATWCAMNQLAFRVDVCSDPRGHSAQLQSSLVELNRQVDSDLVHATYVKKPWNYMHVLFEAKDRGTALRLAKGFVDIGRSLGRCENTDRDLTPQLRNPPYFVAALTGRLPPRVAPELRNQVPDPPASFSLLDLAGL